MSNGRRRKMKEYTGKEALIRVVAYALIASLLWIGIDTYMP